MSRSARWALALWILLAVVIFNVRFDWQSRLAGREFVRSQIALQRQGLPLPTINDGFRPLVRQAAVDAGIWLVLIASAGAGLVLAADRRRHTLA